MSELLLNTIIDKLNMQAQDIETIKERTQTLSINPESLKDLNTQLTSIESSIKKINLPENEIKQLSFDLKRATSILQQPVKNEVVNQHHIPKLLWVTAGLFLMLCMICAGWYTTHDKLKDYIASDTKYRYLKLNTDTIMQDILHHADSLYFSYPTMRDNVIKLEEENRKRAELQEQADEKQKEADSFTRKARQQKK